jgi:hypothetical protein
MVSSKIFYIYYNIRRTKMPEIKYEVVNTIGVVSEGKNGWNKELNLIKWNDREPVYDIRTWSPDHEKIGKGVTITAEEAKILRDMLNSLDLG